MPRLFTYPTLPSTSDTAAALLEAGETPPFAVTAAQQTAGRGQRGREWVSPPGNLYITFALPRRTQAVPLAGFAAALAVREALGGFLSPVVCGPDTLRPDNAAPQRLRLKWPNDVLLDARKVAGLLLENRPDALLVGIGINLAEPPRGPTRWPAGCLAGALSPSIPVPTPHAVRAVLTERLLKWLAAAPERVCAAWAESAWGIGIRINLETETGLISGVLTGISDDGRLRVQTDNTERLLASGRIMPPESDSRFEVE
jgi:BirA family biotin operon repressor/biotin-[acetyl-CoA-carboxylase] ligase